MSEELVERTGQSRELVCLLNRFIGEDDINLRCLGGWGFEGRLISVDDCLAFMTDVKVFPPGIDDSFKLNAITVNLETLTSVGID